ncbi:hypothetical protein [Streptomyces sp. MZ04]|uniref:hypothetical protein n=1 Tax=Streptomyces sp. MZ04 TaxID=2559236 RepID=UPI00107E79D6|nr:hypothetical protein [Streptomyces sp. MZ04]TGB13818.1 hypothetical protein E2651_07690 [Streptomyces sp. MZ04]
MAIELPDDLIVLERSAWEAIQAGTLTVDTALAVQERIREYAAESGKSRLAVETELKKRVRHPESMSDAA